jgi:Flp pilus assembly protein TadG
MTPAPASRGESTERGLLRRRAFRAKRLLSKSESKGLVADLAGAAMVEFAIAILPILITFFGMFQWGVCAYVHLIVKHAAFVAARAEAVIHPHMPDSGPQDDVKKGVMMLFKHVKLVKEGDVTIETTLPNPMAETLDKVTVTVNYKCGIPLGNVIACGAAKTKTFTQSASFPNQGSYYQQVWKADL